MYEKIQKCPLCEDSNILNFLICKDYAVSEECFAISDCKNCGLKFTNPRPDKNGIGKYYESKEYISHSNSPNNLINILYKLARNFTLRNKYKIINKFIDHKGKLLDYGCGTGNFLSYFNKKGWKVTGIEPNPSAKKEAEKNNINVFNSLENLQESIKFDVITLWHVLEHVHELKTTIDNLKSKLTKNGIIFIAVPNNKSYDCRYYKEFWAAYDVPRHLYHFNQDSFKFLIKKSKLKLLDIIPMKLDAYYVSMLSEKYKSGKNNILKAFIKGHNSNKWASINNNNYSSLIYILKK